MLYIGLYRENMKKCLKPQDLEPWYLVCSIHFDEAYFINNLQAVPWDLIKLFDDPDDILEAWTDLFLEVVDKHIPIKNTGLSEKPNLIG